MNDYNKLVEMFEEGSFYLAITGNEVILKDHTWGQRDYLLIFCHLLKWLRLKDDSHKDKEALENTFIMILQDKDSISKIDGGLISLHILICYCIESSDIDFWFITRERISEMLSSYRKINLDYANIKRDLARINKYLVAS